MLTRRQFLKRTSSNAGGLTFCSCGLLRVANAQSNPVKKPPVIINGKTIKAIDVHAHCYF